MSYRKAGRGNRGASCGDCAFYRKGDASASGECRRNAPRPRSTYRCDHEEAESTPTAWWPTVGQGDWCGEHQPRSP